MRKEISRMRMVFVVAIKLYKPSRGMKGNILAEMSLRELVVWTEDLMEMYDNEGLLDLSVRMAVTTLGGAIV
jgi:hypothetical protein